MMFLGKKVDYVFTSLSALSRALKLGQIGKRSIIVVEEQEDICVCGHPLSMHYDEDKDRRAECITEPFWGYGCDKDCRGFKLAIAAARFCPRCDEWTATGMSKSSGFLTCSKCGDVK